MPREENSAKVTGRKIGQRSNTEKIYGHPFYLLAVKKKSGDHKDIGTTLQPAQTAREESNQKKERLIATPDSRRGKMPQA